MNANRLINMVLRMVMRKGMNMAARRMGGSQKTGDGVSGQNTMRQTAKVARNIDRLNRRL